MHQVLFDIHGFTIYSYGGMLMLSFLGATMLAVRLGRHRERRYSDDAVVELVMGCIIAGVVGARLGHVLQSPVHYLHHPLLAINLREGGMTITGGLILSVVWLVYKYRSAVLDVYDFMAGPVILGMAIGRLGCLLHGCCFGSMCDLPWGVTYPPGVLGALPPGPRHPSQLYEAGMDLMLLAFLLYRFKSYRYAGQLFYTFFAGYGVIRFLDELTRYVEPSTIMGPLNLYQWIAIGFFLLGSLGLLGAFGRPAKQLGFLPQDSEESHPHQAS